MALQEPWVTRDFSQRIPQYHSNEYLTVPVVYVHLLEG